VRAHQSFGGQWTEAKLTALQKYLKAYVTLMHGNRRAVGFRLTYLDGFAGSGRRYVVSGEVAAGLFADFNDAETQAFYKGSACRALEVEPPFDEYVFIERKAEYAVELQQIVAEFPQRAGSVRILQRDANLVVPEWCGSLRSNDRALVFLDPYGMQVDWTTVEAIGSPSVGTASSVLRRRWCGT
jgi:three-Cys-motif partner protein